MALFAGNLEGGMGCQKGVQGLSFTYNDVSGKDSGGWGRSMEFLRQLRGSGISSGLNTKPSNPWGLRAPTYISSTGFSKGGG